MGAVVDRAVELLTQKVAARPFEGSALFVMTGEGSILMDGSEVREGDGAADVTLTAEPETFQAILAGEMDATAAFMTGKLTIDGDMGLAMKLAAVLA